MNKNFIRKAILSSALAVATVNVFAQGAFRDGWGFNSFENTLADFKNLPGWGLDYNRSGFPPYTRTAGINILLPGWTARLPVLHGVFQTVDKFGWSRSYKVPNPDNPIVGVNVGMHIGPGDPFNSELNIDVSVTNETKEEQYIVLSPYFDPSVATEGDDYSELTDISENSFRVVTTGYRGVSEEAVTIDGYCDGLLYAFEVGEAPFLDTLLFSDYYELSGRGGSTGNTGCAFDLGFYLQPGETQNASFTIRVRR